MGRRGPPRTPDALRLAYSQPSKDNDPGVQAPPVVEAPKAPDWITGYAEREWERLVPLMMEVRLLTDLDLQNLAAYCEAVRIARDSTLQMRRRRRKGDPKTIAGGMIIIAESGAPYLNPLHSAKMQAMRDMSKYAKELGLTPSARAAISLGEHGGYGKAGERSDKEQALARKFKI